MCYQTQSYGNALLHLKTLIENMDQVEEFIQIKALFLTLQIMFELRLKFAAQPIIDILEIKKFDIERLFEQKKSIKNSHNSGSSTKSQPDRDTATDN